ncbi:bahd acyltransferase dcr [Phtheirospermum japonicum]|uniref:Bahd acyltransferase dcr n=1 Tax=Phtheirospermum japonicum TaxID=374723 RepID=A0A830BAD9_9LAMI|nr:bahd acyltransferase dcr [Phtheirospermum japonicum]
MNSGSDSRPAIVSGAKITSRSTVPPPSRPGKAEILPSNLFERPLRTATGRPHPKSLSYIGNLGELPIVIIAPSKFPNGKHRGSRSQSSTYFLTAPSPYAATFLFSCSIRNVVVLDAGSFLARVIPATAGAHRDWKDEISTVGFPFLSQGDGAVTLRSGYLSVSLLCLPISSTTSIPPLSPGLQLLTLAFNFKIDSLLNLKILSLTGASPEKVTLGPPSGSGSHRRRNQNRPAGEVRRPRDPLHPPAHLRERVEEVPEGGPVGDGVIHGAADEDAVGQLRQLHGENGSEMAP